MTFGKPRPLTATIEDPHLTSEEIRERIEEELREVRARLERLKVEVDVSGRRR